MVTTVIFLATFFGGFLFPWWWPALAAYAAALWLGGADRGAWRNFLSGFLGAGAAWGGLAAFMDLRNHQLLSARMADLFHLPDPWFLVGITALLGGLIGGLGAWSGSGLRQWIRNRRQVTSSGHQDR